MASIFSYTLPIFSSILRPNWTVQKDVQYGSKVEQTADLYLLNNSKDAPAIIFIHGGGWAGGDKSVYGARAKMYALAGFNVISINYTLANSDLVTHWPAQLEDIRAALTWVRSHSFQWGIDPNRIAVGGDSAGGHLALWLGINAPAVLNMFGPCDLTQPKMAEVIANLDVFGKQTYEENPQLYIDASPLFKMNTTYPPTFVAHSTDDNIVPYQQAEVLIKRLTQLNVYTKLVTYTGGHDLSKVPWYKTFWLELRGLWFMLDNI